jgi:D-alanyl-lipoteichoic acid acyltransferase DltB (MBOAT superfamily)
MLFNSYQYILFFLPITAVVFFWLRKRHHEAALAWLVGTSLFYYGWWNPSYLAVIVSSILANFGIARLMSAIPVELHRRRQFILLLGITSNLVFLGYFKYTAFVLNNINEALAWSISVPELVLPLAISFFSFQQIAYLVDVYRGQIKERNFIHYALFVTFFPQLIAGPIVHHAEMMPQFKIRWPSSRVWRNLAIGLTIFAIGLFKKAVLADGVAAYASPVFAAAAEGARLSFFEAWGGALAYTMQLYFDFSGYSDMAIGSAFLFGIRLPINFFSPYKATSIIEFWRRWHITLSRFLRDYLYIPLGGNRHGPRRRYVNLFLTMLLGGLWHGAGWTFVFWGALHGVYLIVNHAWLGLRRASGLGQGAGGGIGRFLGWLVTFLAVVVGWVFFRAEDMPAAFTMLAGMIGANGVALPNGLVAALGPGAREALGMVGIGTYLGGGTVFLFTYLWIALTTTIALAAPNLIQLMRRYRPTITRYQGEDRGALRLLPSTWSLRWAPTWGWGTAVGLVGAASILSLMQISEFLYFQF